MKEIKLTRGLVTKVDDEDYEMLMRHKWCAHVTRKRFYATTDYIVNGKYKTIYMHRLLMNPEGKQQVDHIDRDSLNNQRNNLRICNNAQNNCNVPSKGGKSKYKGISVIKETSSAGNEHVYYRAEIMYDKKKLYICKYKDEIRAAMAYDKKAKELFGEFAYLNFPEK